MQAYWFWHGFCYRVNIGRKIENNLFGVYDEI